MTAASQTFPASSRPWHFMIRWPAYLTLWHHKPLVYSGFYNSLLNLEKPAKVILAPTDPWHGDAGSGMEITQGVYSRTGKRFPFTIETWLLPPTQDASILTLHTFSWLRDLHALGGDKARSTARKHVAAWLQQYHRLSPDVWTPNLTAERLCHWLMHYSFYGVSGDHAFCFNLHKTMAKHFSYLRHIVAGLPPTHEKIVTLKAILFGCLCLHPEHSRTDYYELALMQELNTQLDEQGNHLSHNPAVVVDILRHLIDVRVLYHLAHRAIPEIIQETISAISAMVQFSMHGDRNLAIFHGGYEIDNRFLQNLLNYTALKRPADRSIGLGLYKKSCGDTTLFIDAHIPNTSTPPYAGALSFEVSVGRHRLIVNCGAYPYLPQVWQDVLRSTQAHSTASVNDTSSALTDYSDPNARQRLTEVTLEEQQSGNYINIFCAHNGYKSLFDIMHYRTFNMSRTGAQIQGEDLFQGAPNQAVAIRFHLHPTVKAVLDEKQRKVYLDLPNSDLWSFTCSDGQLTLEDSIYIGQHGQKRSSQQIIVRGVTDNHNTCFKWALQRN